MSKLKNPTFKVDSKLEDGLRMMGIHIKVVADDIQEDKE